MLNVKAVADASGVDWNTGELYLKLLETFVVGELRKPASWMDGVAGLGHWLTWMETKSISS